MLEALARWNRWGGRVFDSGIRRDVVEGLQTLTGTAEVIALVGPRRSGKTTVLHQLMDQLVASGVPVEALLHVNFEEPGFAGRLGVNLLEELYETYRHHVYPSGRAHLFLDEIQHVPQWESWVRARKETEEIKVFVTGSSSALMSREMGTLLTGRHLTFRIMPLGFGEFLRFKGVRVPLRPDLARTPATIQHALLEYLKWGGFPEVVLASDDGRKESLLKQYFDDVLFKDIAIRHKLRDLPELRALAVHLLTQTASLVSCQRLSRIHGASLDQTKAYGSYLAEAFLVAFSPFFSLKVSERRRQPQKVHAVDLGLRNVVCFSGSPDIGRLAETAVFNAVGRSPNDGLHYWKGNREVDLVMRRGTQVGRVYQVAFEGLEEKDTRDRELGGLEEALQTFRKARGVLVVGRMPAAVPDLPDRAEIVPLWRFLLEDETSTRPATPGSTAGATRTRRSTG